MSSGPQARLVARVVAWLVAAPFAAFGSLPRASPQEEPAREAPAGEGALDNDVFVPVSAEAAQALSNGDQALARARAAATAGNAAEAGRQLDVAFDHWRAALGAGGPGASTWLEDAAAREPRLAEGVHAGVVRRLVALQGDERARWSARQAPAAAALLTALHAHVDGLLPDERTQRLEELVRLFPLSAGAARAALELGDLALEAGLGARARGWYARAELEAELSGERAALSALEVRRAAVDTAAPARDEAWQRASACDFAGSIGWSDPARRARSGSEPERWLRPGGAFLSDQTVVVQTPSELHVLALAANGALERSARLRPADFLGGYTPGEFEAPRAPPGWPLLPLADEQGLVLVVGRTDLGEPNALLALELTLPAHADLGLKLEPAASAARLAWAVVGAERILPTGVEALPELEDLGDYEFQPGPVASGDRVVVQARQFGGQVQSLLLAFDRRDGRLAWRRQLAGGADLVATQRFAQSSKRVAGQPLLALEVEDEPRIFAGTHLGLGVLVDGLLGEPLWSFKNRRRAEREAGWSGDRPPLAASPAGAPLVLWGPMDSDRLYTLVPRPLSAPGDGTAVLARAPDALLEAQTLLGGDADEHLVLGRAGRERTISARRPGRDRIDALDLPPDERFAGTGLVSPARVWVASDRSLYLFDRTRELYLLDSDTLPPVGAGPLGGDVLARGTHVLVLGPDALWSFRVR